MHRLHQVGENGPTMVRRRLGSFQAAGRSPIRRNARTVCGNFTRSARRKRIEDRLDTEVLAVSSTAYVDFEEMELHSTVWIDKNGRVHWARTGGEPLPVIFAGSIKPIPRFSTPMLPPARINNVVRP
jgi:hypothetical protein